LERRGGIESLGITERKCAKIKEEEENLGILVKNTFNLVIWLL
jgi:hypothetical protein